MAGTLSDGRERVPGLSREGLRFKERARLAEARLDLAGFRATLGDVRGKATAAFSSSPSNVLWLAASVSSTDTTWTVNSTAGVAAGDRYHVGTECVRVVSVDSGTQLTVARGEWDSIAQAHERGYGGELAFPPAADVPLVVSGRRVWLYAHGETELGLTDTGVIAYKGQVGAEPELEGGDAVAWSLLIDPPTRILDQEIGSEGGEFRITGIYYPWNAPLVVEMRETYPTTDSTEWIKVSLTGRWETNAAFAAALQDEIKTAITAAGWTGSLAVQAVGDTDWFLVVDGSSGGSGPAAGYWIEVEVRSTVDGTLRRATPHEVTDASTTAAAWYYEWAADTGFRGVPRMAPPGEFAPDELGDEATWPETRLYLDRAWALTAGDTLRGTVEAPQRFVDRRVLIVDEGEEVSVGVEVDAVDAAAGFVTWTYGGLIAPAGLPSDAAIYLLTLVPMFKGARRITAAGSVADFRDDLVAASPELANATGVPLITGDDVADWQDVIAAAAGSRPYLTRRRYEFGEPVKLEELLMHEWRLAGVYPIIDRDFKIALAPLRAVGLTEGLGGEETDDALIVSKGFGKVAHNADGLINHVTIKTGWNEDEGEHVGPTFNVRDVASQSAFKKARTLEIEPKTASETDPSTPEDARSIAEPVLGFYGQRYAVVDVDVGPQSLMLRIGDAVRVVSPQLPRDGLRGLDAVGLIVGREWDLATGMGTLSLFIHDSRSAGYAPTGRVASQSGSGTDWDLTLEENRYGPGGQADASFFAVGDQVRVYEWDDETPTIVRGEVDAVSGNVVSVTFDATWTPGASTWNLAYDESTDAADDQFRFAFLADTDVRIDQGSGESTPAKELAP